MAEEGFRGGLRVCVVHGQGGLDAALRAQGHEVLSLRPDALFANLPDALSKADFKPDMVVQVERLSRRTLLSGLDEVDCPKAFWSVDTHLNLFWHTWYGRLFDLVFTTQRAWIRKLQRAGLGSVEWLPWFGVRRPFTPHPKRARDVVFVGRVSSHRPVRGWFAAFLKENYGVEPLADLTFAQMMDHYSDSRLVPNETIFGEVNFRLFEAASCGCAVFSPDISDEVAELFEPGVEMELFDHVLDLKFLLDRYRADPARAMKMGLAAWERVQREHLVEHRAGRLVDLLSGAPRKAVQGIEARRAVSMTMFSLWEAGRLDLDETYLLGLLRELGTESEALGARLRALAFMGRHKELEQLVGEVVRLGRTGDMRLSCLCSLAALRLKQWDLAKLLWYKHVESLENRTAPKPETPAQLYRLWAREHQRLGQGMRVGFVMHEERHLPVTAAECLWAGLHADKKDMRTHARMAQLMAGMRGAESARMGFLSHLSLLEPENWRTSLELALTHLGAFRMQEGLAELFCAKDKAAAAGELDRLQRILRARDHGGLLMAALEN